ncbi:hypothetical protein [Haloarchaeobius amylolyticus]|uniref:hypothetical protein n=1 Tax=Haloarchaeobius amylolyticus TaxID=1198296 RepID=UPI00226EB6E5|nr:hypothetical protein [Haloarchaeobius amylolyticus]
MRRRNVLASLGATLVAGCTTTLTGDDPATTTTTAGDPPTDTPAGTGGTTAEFTVSEFDLATTKVGPTKPYYLRITAVYSAEAVEREEGDQTVMDVSEIENPEHRAVVKEILSEGKLWREAVPDGLQALTERVDFFTWEANTDSDDTASHWGVAVYQADPDGDPALQFDAELVDDHLAPGDPGVIAFSLTNTGDQTQSVFSGTVPPFSVLFADGPRDDQRALLWRDYTEEGCVSFAEVDGEATLMTCSIGISTPVEPGETIEKEYELRPAFEHDALRELAFDAPGRYTVAETLSYERDGVGQGPSTEVDWRVEFELESS